LVNKQRKYRQNPGDRKLGWDRCLAPISELELSNDSGNTCHNVRPRAFYELDSTFKQW
jgi:hypothetical protein